MTSKKLGLPAASALAQLQKQASRSAIPPSRIFVPGFRSERRKVEKNCAAALVLIKTLSPTARATQCCSPRVSSPAISAFRSALYNKLGATTALSSAPWPMCGGKGDRRTRGKRSSSSQPGWARPFVFGRAWLWAFPGRFLILTLKGARALA